MKQLKTAHVHTNKGFKKLKICIKDILFITSGRWKMILALRMKDFGVKSFFLFKRKLLLCISWTIKMN